jgi:hypothetical protein
MKNLVAICVFGLFVSLFSVVSYADLSLSEVDLALKPELTDHYKAFIFVNAATSGPHQQKMWVFEREENVQTKNKLKLTLWDSNFWGEATPTFSWPVSTGRIYEDEEYSGPTIQGIFNIADQEVAWDPIRKKARTRFKKDYYKAGMYDALFFDLAYSTGRLSGVAFHGTTPGMYANLGFADSHGCVRLHQDNSEQLWNWIFRPGFRDYIPSFWTNDSIYGEYTVRRNYYRRGELVYNKNGNLKTHIGFPVLLIIYFDTSDLTPYDLGLLK